jgi:6-phosphofructokinase 2
MPKIITLTFNPCIDKNTNISSLAPEKKLRCTKPEFEPGGGGINVSRVLHCLGEESLSIFPCGGYTGEFLKQLMGQEKLAFDSVETESHTRENLIVFEEATQQQYRFGMPGNDIEEKDWEALLKKVEETDAEFIVASGSLLPGMPAEKKVPAKQCCGELYLSLTKQNYLKLIVFS